MMKHTVSKHIFLMLVLLFLFPMIILFQYNLKRFEKIIQEQLSEKTVQSLGRNKDEINLIFEKMLNISTIFIYSPMMRDAFGAGATRDYYQRYKAFAGALESIEMQNLYEDMLSFINVTFIDKNGDVFSNQPLPDGYGEVIRDSEFFKTGAQNNGYAHWLVGPNPFTGEPTIIAYSRSIPDPDNFSTVYGTMVVSLNQTYLYQHLTSYLTSPRDMVFATDAEGRPLLYDATSNTVPDPPSISSVWEGKPEGYGVVGFHGKDYLVSFFSIGPAGLMSRDIIRIFYLTDYEAITAEASRMMFHSNLFSMFFLCLILCFSIFLAKTVGDPIRRISLQMHDFTIGVTPEDDTEMLRDDEVGEISRSFHQMATDINHLFANLKEEHAKREQYYLESMKSKLNPHFLFNTLNSIRWMAIIRKADNIRASIDALATILQYHLSDNTKEVPLSKEYEIVQDYCYIQNIRFGNRCTLESEIPSMYEHAAVMKFILQPIVENCFRHAFSGSQLDCRIMVKASGGPGCLIIDILDNGKGFSEESLEDFKQYGKRESGKGGIGLRLVNDMIRAYYGEGYGLVPANQAIGSDVRITLPLKEADA